jgi:predicted ATPase
MELLANKPVVCPMIVGRATELTALHAIVREVEEGQSRIVLLSGEADIGKSRLVAEIETEAGSNGFLVLQGNCFQRDLTSPYAPLLDLLRLSIANKPPEVREAELQPFAQELFPLLPDLVTPSPSSTVLPTSLPELEKLDVLMLSRAKHLTRLVEMLRSAQHDSILSFYSNFLPQLFTNSN